MWSSWTMAACALVIGACDEKHDGPLVAVPREQVVAVVETPADRQPAVGEERVRGTGWYANVEVDETGRVHLAWVDADQGDVLYTSRASDAAAFDPPAVVEHQGAVGSYLRLALAPGGAPILLYYHQDERTLRLAHRAADLPRMKAAGVDVDETPLAVPGAAPADARMGPGFIGEDVTFGDQVGVASALFVDDHGVPHFAYYAKGTRFRYGTRAPGVPAFGGRAHERFTLMDVDREAGSSYTMRSDLHVAKDGTVTTAFCHWTFSDAALKVARKAPGAAAFDVRTAKPSKDSDGWQVSIVPGVDGALHVFSVAIGAQRLFEVELAPGVLALPETRMPRLDRPAAAVVARRADGTRIILARGNGVDEEDRSGIWLAELPPGAQRPSSRLLLDEGAATDPWIDLALRADGRPVAVWTSADHRSLRLYAP